MRASPFRRIAVGTWDEPRDPTIYASFPIRMEPALAYLERQRALTGRHLTVTHLVVKAAGEVLRACPEANTSLRFWTHRQRRSVDVSVLVSMGPKAARDLASAKIARVDRLAIEEIADELHAQAARVRSGDTPLEKARRRLACVPGCLMRAALRVVAFLACTLRLPLPERDPFGGAVVTSIGSLGLARAFAPLVAYTRSAMVLAPGCVVDEAVVEGGRVVAGKLMWLSCAFDHRMLDGTQIAEIARVLQQVLQEPEAFSARSDPR